jgi:ferritin-like metal-binding protein YciE
MAWKLESLQDLYLDELRDLYHAETQLALALPEMAKAAKSDDLRRAFEEDAGRTQGHLQRLQRIFQNSKKDPSGHPCKAMEGLLQEGQDLFRAGGQNAVVDAGLIVTAQKAQHYEIAGYGSACTFARVLGRGDEEKILHQTMDEEKQADAVFTQMANRAINMAAAAPGS